MSESDFGAKNNTHGDMSAADFRRFGHEIIDWIADYLENIETLPVLSEVEPNWLKEQLPKSAPETDLIYFRVNSNFCFTKVCGKV